MNWSLKLGAPLGIGVYVHWTFGLLLGWVAFSLLNAGGTVAMAAQGILFVLAVFGCVLLHEFGHALAARRYGIPTKDITLLPIGGVARLERMPERPSEELVVALAGPAVNVVIAVVLAGLLLAVGGVAEMPDLNLLGGAFLPQLLMVNIVLVLFNMIPAFPMDGGRVLRALLATRFDYALATTIAANVGRVIAVMMGVYGFATQQYILMLISVFIFFVGGAEARAAVLRGALRGARVAQVMATRFRTLAPHNTIGDAANALMAGSQRDFPVLHEGRLVGMLRREELQRALGDGRWMEPLGRVMRHDYPTAAPHDSLEPVTFEMQSAGWLTIPVISDHRLVGLLTQQNIEQWIELAPGYGGDRIVEAELVSTNAPHGDGASNGSANGARHGAQNGAAVGHGTSPTATMPRYPDTAVSDALLRGYCDTLFGGRRDHV